MQAYQKDIQEIGQSLLDDEQGEVIQERIESSARNRADKLIRKNKRELDRLKKHAGECLLEDNFQGYSYAIKKLRDFYRQPYTDELILQMWNSSVDAMIDIAKNHAAKLKAQ